MTDFLWTPPVNQAETAVISWQSLVAARVRERVTWGQTEVRLKSSARSGSCSNTRLQISCHKYFFIQAHLTVCYFNEHWQNLDKALLSCCSLKRTFYPANHRVGRDGFLTHVGPRLNSFPHIALFLYLFTLSSLPLTSKSQYNRVPDLEQCQ